jgi:hypothetical protein
MLLAVQSGFRPGQSTVEQIVTVRSIVVTCRTRHKSVSRVFVDFSKVFGIVSRSAIREILSVYGVPRILITAIMDLYIDTFAFVQIGSERTKEFSSSSGVLQGDTLAPFLFVVLDYVLRLTLYEADGYVVSRRRSRRHPAVTLEALAYADDITLACKDPEAA